MPGIYSCEIVGSKMLAESVYSIAISCPGIANTAVAGQFVNIKCGGERLLRRPVSICGVDEDELTFVFEVKGEGTYWLSGQAPGQNLDVLGPLGNGFSIPEGKMIVVGGGIGAPPMLFAAQTSKDAVTAVLGFRDMNRIILKNEFESICDKVYMTTDDGSRGIHGTVITPLAELLKRSEYDAVLACGPRVMLRAVAEMCKQCGVPCQVSLEERMGCGVGACVVCACATIKDGAERMSRVCKDGPVFDANEIAWQMSEG